MKYIEQVSVGLLIAVTTGVLGISVAIIGYSLFDSSKSEPDTRGA
jgi:hypothetical protein